MSPMHLCSRLAAAAALVVCAAASHAFGVGDAAPALNIGKWAKGTPVKSFEKGKVYVVEFWATWCGPCRTTIPHLTELAKKMKGKATVIGVSVWEEEAPKNTNYYKTVEAFVKEMGAKMDYNVAIDGPGGAMAKTWMEAAKQDGIPAAFVVDQQGKIAWIGHPMDGLDKVVEQVVAGKFDAKAAAAEKAKKDAMLGEIQKALEADNNDLALTKIDAFITAYPESEADMWTAKLGLSYLKSADLGNAYAEKLRTGFMKGNSEGLNELAWMMVNDDDPLDGASASLAVKIALDALAAVKNEPIARVSILDTIAYAYFKDKKLDEAISYGQMAVDEGKKLGKEMDPDAMKEIEANLAKYKKAKGDWL